MATMRFSVLALGVLLFGEGSSHLQDILNPWYFLSIPIPIPMPTPNALPRQPRRTGSPRGGPMAERDSIRDYGFSSATMVRNLVGLSPGFCFAVWCSPASQRLGAKAALVVLKLT